MNPEIPWSIFLPPPDFSNIHVLGTQDVNGFNAGMLMIRVDQWSVRALSEVLALHNLKPDVPLPFYDQSAIDWVFLQPHNRDHFLFQPRHWWNRYFFTGDGDEPGEMLLHFAGIGAVSGGSQEKEKVMRKYLERVENEPQNWSKDLSKTPYEKEIAEFWATVRKAQKALQKTASWLETRVENPNANQVLDLRKTLQEMLLRQTDRVDWMIGNTTQLEKLLRD